MNADGSSKQRLLAAKACHPVWSPDVYLSDSRGCSFESGLAGERGYRAVYRINVAGTGCRLLAQGSIGGVAWPPDGARIAYTDQCVARYSASEWACGRVMVMNADGNGKHALRIKPSGENQGWVQWVAEGP